MKRETLRKLKHRILAGILCFSIVFAAQPNALNASMLMDTENTEAYESIEEDRINEGSEEEMSVDEQTELDEVKTEDFPDASLTEERTEEGSEDSVDEAMPEDVEATIENDALSEEEYFLNEDTMPVTAQAEAVHQHSVSTDCSTSDGEQTAFTALTQDFTGGTLSGNYYLSEDVTLDSTMVISSGTVRLCLNGHTLQYGGADTANVIRVNANLYICDCGTTGCITGGTSAGIYIPMGKLFLYSGTIKGNTSTTPGGGVTNYMGDFEMYGGSISGNSATYGGGIYNSERGTFKMNGGSISGNSATNNVGGGVYNLDYATFEINGGTISGNSARNGSGVCLGRNNTFIMNGGSISDNLNGSGVYIHINSRFEMNNGIISGHTATSGGGVWINEGSTFVMNGGTISNNHAVNTGSSAICGGGVYNSQGTFEMNGGEITENSSSQYAGGVYSMGGTFRMSGGSIFNNTADRDGGGVWATGGSSSSERYYSTFIMSGGSIFNNTADGNGGGVSANDTFKMSGGTISNNTADGNGGGVYLTNGSTIFEMSDGTISDNSAKNGGGGVYLANLAGVAKMRFSGKPVISGNKITDNTNSNVQLYSTSNITITAPLQQGTNVGITFQKGTTVITDSPFAVPVAGTDGLDISQYTRYFTSDVDGYGVLYQDGSTAGRPEGLYLENGVTVTYDYAENGGSSSSLASSFVERNGTLDLFIDGENTVTATKAGWEFVGWNTDKDATEGLTSLTVGTSNMTLYAIYKKTITANFFSGADKQKTTQTVTLYNNGISGTIQAPSLSEMPGWTAIGWDTDANGYAGAVPERDNITISKDTDYYGVYRQNITLSYDANGGTTAPASETKERYATVGIGITYRNPVFTLAPAVSYTGYTFDGWHMGSSTGTIYRPGKDVELTGNTTFYAGWRADTDRSYVVEHYWQDVTGDGYTLLDTEACTGTAGADVEAEARTYTGFAENTEHPSRKASGIIAEDGSLVLRLYYDRNIYTVSFDLNGGEGTPPEAQTIRYGETLAPVQSPVREGYAFTGWYTDQETESGSRWDFTAAVEENERNQNRINRHNANSRSVTHREIVLYAGWRKEAVDTPNEPAQPGKPTEPGTGDTNGNTINNNIIINNSNTGTSNPTGKPVPGTGDTAHLELYATAAMIAGLSYLLLELADERGMTEEQKRELTARLIQWAKGGGSLRRIVAVLGMFLLLAYYHAIGKQIFSRNKQVL